MTWEVGRETSRPHARARKADGEKNKDAEEDSRERNDVTPPSGRPITLSPGSFGASRKKGDFHQR